MNFSGTGFGGSALLQSRTAGLFLVLLASDLDPVSGQDMKSKAVYLNVVIKELT